MAGDKGENILLSVWREAEMWGCCRDTVVLIAVAEC